MDIIWRYIIKLFPKRNFFMRWLSNLSWNWWMKKLLLHLLLLLKIIFYYKLFTYVYIFCLKTDKFVFLYVCRWLCLLMMWNNMSNLLSRKYFSFLLSCRICLFFERKQICSYNILLILISAEKKRKHYLLVVS